MEKSNFIETIFLNILIYSYLLPVLPFIFSKQWVKQETPVRIVVIYSIILFILLFSFDHIPRVFSLHTNQILITFSELFFYSLFYYHIILNEKFKRFILWVIPLFFIFQILHEIFSKRANFDAIPSGTEAIIILTYTVYFFYEELRKSPDKSFYNNYLFWISLGIMLYLAGTFFIFILANNMPAEQVNEFWFFTYVIETLKNILITIAIIMCLRAKNKEPLEKKQPNLDFTP